MATEKMTMMTNFDYDALFKWAENHDITITDISRSLGFNSSYFTNAKKRNRLPKSSYNFLLMKYNLPDGSFIKKEEKAKLKTHAEKVVDNPTTDLTEIYARFKDIGNELTDLNISVNKLGNIMMQILEYIKDIRDEVK